MQWWVGPQNRPSAEAVLIDLANRFLKMPLVPYPSQPPHTVGKPRSKR